MPDMNGHDEERLLIAGLRALAQSTATEEAPPRVEAALLRAFRQRARERPARTSAAWWVVGAAAAALALVFAVIWRPDAARVTESSRPPQARAITIERPRVEMPASRPGGAGQSRRARIRRPQRAAAVERPGEVVTDFFPLPYAETLSPLEPGYVVRVKLPRSALSSLGLSVNEERAAEPVRADVVLGQDGLARAIRFVRAGGPRF